MTTGRSAICGCIRCLTTTVASIAFITGGAQVRAEQIIFTIDPLQSTETVSGVDNVKGTLVAQSSGSLQAAISGNYLVTFDPLNNNPPQITFNGGQGFFKLSSTNSGSPAPGSVPGSAPANVAGRSADGSVQFAFRNIVWDFNTSVPVAVNGGSIDATQVGFKVLSGTFDTTRPDGLGLSGSFVSTHYSPLNGGTFSLSSDNAGNWTLGMDAIVGPSAYNNGLTTGSLTYTGHIVSTAHFGVSNTTQVPQPQGAPVQVQALGGATQTGGVTVGLNQNSTAGTLSVQQVPNNTSIPAAAVAAIQSNPLFLLSASTFTSAPQIWNVEYDGTLGGGTATVVFHYDPTHLPTGVLESDLVMWHFNKVSNIWEHSSSTDLNVTDHTITYTVNSFSPFELGTAVAAPEPSSIALAAMGFVGLIAWGWRRRQR